MPVCLGDGFQHPLTPRVARGGPLRAHQTPRCVLRSPKHVGERVLAVDVASRDRRRPPGELTGDGRPEAATGADHQSDLPFETCRRRIARRPVDGHCFADHALQARLAWGLPVTGEGRLHADQGEASVDRQHVDGEVPAISDRRNRWELDRQRNEQRLLTRDLHAHHVAARAKGGHFERSETALGQGELLGQLDDGIPRWSVGSMR